jgi:S1-C subfamily serine protease
MRHAALILLFSTSLLSQESKPRIYVRAKGTVNSMTQGAAGGGLFGGSRYDSIVDEHDESIELTKELRQRCDGVIVTLKEEAADYVVMLNRESKAKRGVFNKNSQVLVADRNGDVIWTKDVRAVASAAKDVCAAVMTRGVRNAAQSTPATAVQASVPATAQDPSPATATSASVPVTSPQGRPSGTAVPAFVAVAAPQSAPPSASVAESSSNSQQRSTSVRRASLGIAGADWEEGQYRGVEVMDVRENGSGQFAGLHKGDIIMQVNGKTISSAQDLATVLASMEAGARIDIAYITKTNLGWITKQTAAILAKAD